MKVKLISDFRDYYDHHFDNDGEPFRRVTTDGLNRIEILEYLQKLEFTTPLFGKPPQLIDKLAPTDQVVLHHDLHAHCGEGKELIQFDCALAKYPDTFATQFIKFQAKDTPPNVKGLSWRYLQVGTESFWLEFTSIEDWRSNCGDGDIQLLFRDKTELFPDYQYENLLKFKFPLFAVDFVPADEKLYAVDFNIAPGCGNTIKPLLPAKEAADAIKKAYALLKKEI